MPRNSPESAGSRDRSLCSDADALHDDGSGFAHITTHHDAIIEHMTQSSPSAQHPAASHERQGAALDASVRCRIDDRGVLAVSGSEAATFLNSQFSSDITALQPGDAMLTSYSDARGRVLATPCVLAEAGQFLLLLPRERLAPIQQQLTKFKLRADVRIEDRSSDHTCLGIAGPAAASALESVLGALPAEAWDTLALPAGGTLVRMPGARPRWLACAPAEALTPLWNALEGRVVTADSDAWHLLDIETGVPEVVDATAEHFVAQMLNLDRLGAIDFHKGCYPGQEVIARTHYLGRIKRRMHVLRSQSGNVPAPGDTVYGDGQSAGEVVTAAPHPEGGSIALAVLRLDATGSTLTLGDAAGPPATASAPPYGLAEEA